jgi:hypothetical protein
MKIFPKKPLNFTMILQTVKVSGDIFAARDYYQKVHFLIVRKKIMGWEL